MKRLAALVVLAAFVTAGCFKVESKTSPTSTSAQVLGGTWSTIESLPGVSGSLQDSCTNFRWSVTEFTGTSGSGTFSATCLGNVQVVGSARGTLVGTTVNWSANVTGTPPGGPACAIALAGSAILETDRIRIPYSGTTCLGSVSGTETIKR